MVILKKLRQRITNIPPGFRLFLVTLPFLALYFALSYLPLTGWRFAFYNYKPGLKLKDCEYVGFYYFTTMFTNPIMRREFFRVMKNTLIMSTMSLATSFLPMFFAILLNELRSMRYKKLVQTLTTIPHFVSWVLVYAIAFCLFSTDGLISTVLVKVGIIDTGINFLSSISHPRLSMWLWGMWKGLGWSAVVYLAALGSIDSQLYDAAAVDGAGRFQKMRHVTLPGLLPTFITLLIMNIGNFLSNGMMQYYLFGNPFTLEKIEVLDLYVYNLGITGGNIPLSIAVGIWKSFVGLFLLIIANTLSGKVREEKVF